MTGSSVTPHAAPLSAQTPHWWRFLSPHTGALASAIPSTVSGGDPAAGLRRANHRVEPNGDGLNFPAAAAAGIPDVPRLV